MTATIRTCVAGLMAVLAVVLGGCTPIAESTAPPLVLVREGAREDGTGRSSAHASSYAFIDARADDPTTPNGWFDSCQPIRYRVSTTNAPPGGIEEIQEAVARIAEASGFAFEFVGLTDEVPTSDYGESYDRLNRFPPVLLAWGDRSTVNRFENVEKSDSDLVGIGGPVRIELSDGTLRYVSGAVMVSNQIEAYETRGFDDRWSTGQIWLHELGHVLGLHHTSDASQAMYERLDLAQGFGAGDLAGLEKLASMPCRDEWAAVATTG